jgi:peptidoglycan-associated lipoprotein
MSSSRVSFTLCALSSASLLFGAALGCSHEQKAPPARPTPPAPVAARVTPPPPPEPPAEAPSEAPQKEEPAIFFDFDSYALRADAHSVLQKVADQVKGKRRANLEIDGNCDELGTTEYNMALGDERARAAKTYLKHLGVEDAQMKTVSYGSERPKYPGHDDDARAKNRRDDLVVR